MRLEIDGKKYVLKPLTWGQAIELKKIEDEEQLGTEMVRMSLVDSLSTAEIKDLPVATISQLIEAISKENRFNG